MVMEFNPVVRTIGIITDLVDAEGCTGNITRRQDPRRDVMSLVWCRLDPSVIRTTYGVFP